MTPKQADRVIAEFAMIQHGWDQAMCMVWQQKLADLSDFEAAMSAATLILDQQPDRFPTAWGQFKACYATSAQRTIQNSNQRQISSGNGAVGIVEHLDWLAAQLRDAPDRRIRIGGREAPTHPAVLMGVWARQSMVVTRAKRHDEFRNVTPVATGVDAWFAEHPEYLEYASTKEAP